MKTIEEIEVEIERAATSETNLHRMTYQQGVEYALMWVIGESPEAPMD